MDWLGFVIPLIVVWFCGVSFLAYFTYEFIKEKNVKGVMFMGLLIVVVTAINWLCGYGIYLNHQI